MMSIYLVQHGKSLPKEADPEKGLSEKGISDVKLIAGVAKNYQIEVEKIVHSGKKRAAQTAALFAEVLQPKEGVSESAGLGPLDDVNVLVSKLDPNSDTMFVGHLPFMEKLVCRLTTGVEGHTIFRFQNGGVLCLDKDEKSGNWFISWALMPYVGKSTESVFLTPLSETCIRPSDMGLDA